MTDAVVQAVTEGRIDSQRQLADQALSILGHTGEAYALSPARARKIASRERAIRIRVMTRRAPRPMLRCPFCDASLRLDDATDIFGKTTTAGRVCPDCNFRMDPGKRGPARYVFELRW